MTSSNIDTLEQVEALLISVAERSTKLRAELRTRSADRDAVTALFAAALAASANLSSENIASLAAAIRQGKLPRRKGA